MEWSVHSATCTYVCLYVAEAPVYIHTHRLLVTSLHKYVHMRTNTNIPVTM